MTDLDGLAALTSVIGGSLRIEGNPALTNLNGLAAITSVGNAPSIFDNDSFTDLD